MSRDVAAPETDGRDGPGRRTTVVLAGLLAVAVVVAAVLGWQLREEKQRADELQDSVAAGVSAEDTAREMIVEMTSYSHDTLDEDFAWMDGFLTDELAEAYRDEIEAIKQFAEAGELVLVGSIADIAHRVHDEDRVVVLAFVDQDVTSEATGRTSTTELRMRLVLTREDTESEWVAENFENLSGQNQAASGGDTAP